MEGSSKALADCKSMVMPKVDTNKTAEMDSTWHASCCADLRPGQLAISHNRCNQHRTKLRDI